MGVQKSINIEKFRELLKMMLKRNILESLTLFCCSGAFICVILNYLTDISPFGGVWLLLYTFLLLSVSITFSFKTLKALLSLNKPIKYDFEALAKKYPHFTCLIDCLPKCNRSATKSKPAQEYKDYDTNELSVISSVLERKLVSSWYVPYISQEIGFPFACKQLLDQMIGKAFQICNKIETKDVYLDTCSVLISHLKEYQKALKRHEKSPNTPIEELYKKSHPVFDNSKKKISMGDHCTEVLRLILKELIPWELWDTPHSELLIRILAKRLDEFVNSTIANPIWLNNKLMNILITKYNVKIQAKNIVEDNNVITNDSLQTTKEKSFNAEIKVPDCKEDVRVTESSVESVLSSVITETTVPVLSREIDDDVKEMYDTDSATEADNTTSVSEPVEVTASPILRQRRGRQGRNEVKIYDRIIEGSVKTWETDVDLQCISLGQDLLASLDGELALSRLWAAEEADGSPNPPRKSSPQLWFGDDENLEADIIQLEASPKKVKEHSPKPAESSPKLAEHSPKLAEHSPKLAEHSPKSAEPSPKSAELLKDIQSTVHQAKTKIGDLQVDSHTDTRMDGLNGDEAAGMMEGLLDFGIAGIKKGLRFTGLSDDSVEREKSPSAQKERPLDKAGLLSDNIKVYNEREQPTTVVPKEENGTAVPTLCKQQRVSSQDSMGLQARPPPPMSPARQIVPPMSPARPLIPPMSPHPSIPPISPRPPTPPSPEPQYEEAADLSTSIAKLRHLLIQRSGATQEPDSELVWEAAEETRGREPSKRPLGDIDTAALADEYDMTADRNSSPGSTSNNMQRLDKLFQRTVTGVFNSLRTAVGREDDPDLVPTQREWNYVTTSVEQSVGGAVARLVGSRRAFTHVDAALDSLEHLAPPMHKELPPPEDFEEWCQWCGCAGAGGGAAAAAAGLLRSHVAVRMATLLLHDIAEPMIDTWLDELTLWLKQLIFTTFEQMAKDECGSQINTETLREYDLDEICSAIMEVLPGPMYLLGGTTVSTSVRLLTSSLQVAAITRDFALRLLDVFVLHFKRSAAVRNPSFEN